MDETGYYLRVIELKNTIKNSTVSVLETRVEQTEVSIADVPIHQYTCYFCFFNSLQLC